MARQKQWDKYEAAILLDYYLQYLDGKLTREKAIRIVSAKLRKMAETKNICIDEIYRNTNGIAFQMHSMESAYKGFTVMEPATKLFIETVWLLKNDKEQYNKLLKEAREMAEVPPKDSWEEHPAIESETKSSVAEFEFAKDTELSKVRNEQGKDAANVVTRSRNTPNGDTFFRWLNEEQGMTSSSCRSYVSAINTAERYAIENNFNHCILYTNNYQEAKATADELFGDCSFMECNDQQHNRLRTAINKLLTYIENGGNDIVVQIPSADLASFTEILIERFPKGYRIGSTIELKRFKRYWEELYDIKIDMDDSSVEKNIEHCGIIHEEKIYMPQKMLDENMKEKLFSYINNSFQSGKSVIYYEALFKEFSDDFFGYCMYNASMLHAYLDYMNDGSYFVGKDYILKDASVKVESYDEIKECLIRQAAPMGYGEIFVALSHISEQKIRNILAQNGEFVSNGRGEYFHIDITTFSDDEMGDITEIIENTIAEKQFISGNELVDSIKKKYPYVIEQNALLSDIGVRNAIRYKLKDKFSFNGNIISSSKKPLSMMGVFADFCRQRASFTLDELKIFKQELGTEIYFDAVYENSLRISKNEFVSKTQASFRLEETDAVIDRFCDVDYIAIRKINQFGLFPDAGFSWNSFLLEHYVAMYSPNYKLLHSNYNEGACVGGIVKKSSGIDTFDELVIDVLARSGIPLQKETALQYLCDEGYMARRNYSGIEQLLIKAKELRNQKGL